MEFTEEKLRAHELVSAPTTVLCKRPKSRLTRKVPNPAQEAWKRFECSVGEELNHLYERSLTRLSQVVNHFSEDNEIVAACIVMGAASAAGDREQTFERIVKNLSTREDARLIYLEAVDHGNVGTLLQKLDDLDFKRQTIISVDDIDRLPESTIRDMVYKCGKLRSSGEAKLLANQGIPPITLVLGVGVSDSRFHSALGIEEAALILPTVISMPSPVQCFRHIVNAIQKTGLEFSRGVFDFLYSEFIHQDRTVSTVMRFLRLLITLHFYSEPLAAVFCEVLEDRSTNDHEDRRARENAMKRNLFKLLKKEHLCRVEKKYIEDDSSQNLPVQEASRNICLSAFEQFRTRRARLATLQRLIFGFCEMCNITPRWEYTNDPHSSDYIDDLHTNVFRAFLVEDGNGEIKFDRFIAPLFGEIRKASRPMIRRMLARIGEEISSLAPLHDEEMSSLSRETATLLKELNNTSGEQMHPPQKRRTQRTRAAKYARGGGAARNRRQQIITAMTDEVQSSDPLVPVRKKLESIILRLTKSIKPLKEIPLHETILVSEIGELQSFSGGMGGPAEPRSSLFTTMRQPRKVLGPLSPSFRHDTAVAYRILAEGGRLVGLYDWYNSFASVVVAGAAKQDNGGNVQIENVRQVELQARFARACSELEALGVMKYTNRKSDHVARIVFE
ncbi:unnamed protein product [Agarophyton chilense]